MHFIKLVPGPSRPTDNFCHDAKTPQDTDLSQKAHQFSGSEWVESAFT